MSSQHLIPKELLGEAAEWLVLWQSQEITEEQKHEFTLWQTQSQAHEQAWEKALTLLNVFEQVPGKVVQQTLENLPDPKRRAALKMLSLAITTVPASYLAYRTLPWQNWHADHNSEKGQQKKILLADDTLLLLNTDSAIDVTFTEHKRLITLRKGEIMISTANDLALQRPFFVDTQNGRIQALGTRFSVRQLDQHTHVAVFESQVEIQNRRDIRRLQAGEQAQFDDHSISELSKLQPKQDLWQQGLLMANSMPLASLIDELSRYRAGVIRLDPTLADLPVSGTFSLKDPDASLALLQQSLPIRVDRYTSWWITISPLPS